MVAQSVLQDEGCDVLARRRVVNDDSGQHSEDIVGFVAEDRLVNALFERQQLVGIGLGFEKEFAKLLVMSVHFRMSI